MARKRWNLSRRYIRGEGIEIGALHHPLPVVPGVRVCYVDHLDLEGLRSHYPEVPDSGLVQVERIDDAETLTTFEDTSLDFVIACHLLEHCENPVGSLKNWLRVLKPGGVLFLAVPDRRFTFDRKRPNTSLDHILRDHREGPSGSRMEHYLEWARLVEDLSEDHRLPRARSLLTSGYSIHFHAWDATALKALLVAAVAAIEPPSVLLRFVRNRSENLAILQREER